MAIQICTEDWQKKHKKKPSGSHYWRFRAVGEPTGRRGKKEIDWTSETDGPFGEARERILKRARKVFGMTAEVIVRLTP